MIPYFGASVYDDPRSTPKAPPSPSSSRRTPPRCRGWRPRRRMSRAPVLRVLACPARPACPHAVGRLSQRGPRLYRPRHRRDVLSAPSTGSPATCRPGPDRPLLAIRSWAVYLSEATSNLVHARGGPVLIHFFLGDCSVRFAPPAACGSVPPRTCGLGAIHRLRVDPEHGKGRL